MKQLLFVLALYGFGATLYNSYLRNQLDAARKMLEYEKRLKRHSLEEEPLDSERPAIARKRSR